MAHMGFNMIFSLTIDKRNLYLEKLNTLKLFSFVLPVKHGSHLGIMSLVWSVVVSHFPIYINFIQSLHKGKAL